MKNKTKKILAGLGLGLVGMSCLTGCTMTDDQKAALDLITEKSDQIINLLEENVKYNNKNLSKEEAAEKIFLARCRWELMDFDEFETTFTTRGYNGIFDEFYLGYSDPTNVMVSQYRKQGNTKVFAGKLNGNYIQITSSDFDKDEHLFWQSAQDGFANREYKTNDFVFGDLVSKFYSGSLGTIEAEQIKDIEVIDNGYKFKIIIKETEGDTEIITESTFIVTFDNYITSIILKQVAIEQETEVSSYDGELNIKYNNINFDALDAKIAELKS